MPIRQGGSSHRTRFHLAADDHLTSGTHFLRTGDVGIVVTVCMDNSSEWREPQQRRHPWHLNAGGGAVTASIPEVIC